MNKRLISLMAAALALLSASGQVEFKGGSVDEHHVIPVTPDMNTTALKKIFVIYDTQGVEMSYRSATGERAKWYTFNNYGVEIPGIQWDGYKTTLTQVMPNTGYIIEEGTNSYACWVVNYVDYELELNDMFFENDHPCSLLTLRIDGSAPKITYHADLNGRLQVLDRDIQLHYNTLEWDDSLHWYEKPVVESFESLEDGIQIVQPLCNTEFMLSGDRFLEEWDIGKKLEDANKYYFHTRAVSCHTTAVQDNQGNDSETGQNNGLGGSAPFHITFTGYPTDAVVYRVWEMATDPEFQQVIRQFNQDVVEYDFDETGTYYMRYRVANDDGSCEAEGDEDYKITADESWLGDESGRLPNVLSLGNGTWKVPHKSIVEFHCWIFNRWGNLVYEFTNPDEGWDGKSHGREVDTGVYYCVVTATGSDGKKYTRRSDITILRYSKTEGTAADETGVGL
jgi:gliding motility-associated-like protein